MFSIVLSNSRFVASIRPDGRNVLESVIDGWMNGWMNGWMDGLMDAKHQLSVNNKCLTEAFPSLIHINICPQKR